MDKLHLFLCEIMTFVEPLGSLIEFARWTQDFEQTCDSDNIHVLTNWKWKVVHTQTPLAPNFAALTGVFPARNLDAWKQTNQSSYGCGPPGVSTRLPPPNRPNRPNQICFTPKSYPRVSFRSTLLKSRALVLAFDSWRGLAGMRTLVIWMPRREVSSEDERGLQQEFVITLRNCLQCLQLEIQVPALDPQMWDPFIHFGLSAWFWAVNSGSVTKLHVKTRSQKFGSAGTAWACQFFTSEAARIERWFSWRTLNIFKLHSVLYDVFGSDCFGMLTNNVAVTKISPENQLVCRKLNPWQ